MGVDPANMDSNLAALLLVGAGCVFLAIIAVGCFCTYTQRYENEDAEPVAPTPAPEKVETTTAPVLRTTVEDLPMEIVVADKEDAPEDGAWFQGEAEEQM